VVDLPELALVAREGCAQRALLARQNVANRRLAEMPVCGQPRSAWGEDPLRGSGVNLARLQSTIDTRQREVVVLRIADRVYDAVE
jgi:hypothetical protein